MTDTMAGESTRAQTNPEVVPAPEANQDGLPPVCKSRLLTWRLLGAVLALLVVLGWVFIIVMLILKEKWQLVLVAWLLLYSAAHFCYWYCKRHSIITLHRQIRLRVLTRMRSGDSGEKSEDGPPTYDEVMDTEAPPPAYFTVVAETNKPREASPAPPPSEAMPAAPQPGVATISGLLQQGAAVPEAKEYLQCPPEYQTPRHMRKLSPRILPAVPVHQARAPTDTAVTATAAATAIATVAAALTAAAPFQAPDEPEEALEEDPIRGPIVRHLRSTTIATLDVSSSEDVTPSVSRSASPVSHEHDEIDDLQSPRPATPGFP